MCGRLIAQVVFRRDGQYKQDSHMKHYTYIFLALLLCSCKPCQSIVETIEKERIVEVHTRDTAIVTEADSASIRALLKTTNQQMAVFFSPIFLHIS